MVFFVLVGLVFAAIAVLLAFSDGVAVRMMAKTAVKLVVTFIVGMLAVGGGGVGFCRDAGAVLGTSGSRFWGASYGAIAGGFVRFGGVFYGILWGCADLLLRRPWRFGQGLDGVGSGEKAAARPVLRAVGVCAWSERATTQ